MCKWRLAQRGLTTGMPSQWILITLVTLFIYRPAEAQVINLPPADRNNLWYHPTGSPTVFVFVHGIFSDSRTCWLYTTPEGRDVYWPELIKSDARFEDAAIYLGGYYTETDSSIYEIQNAADELYSALKRTDESGNPSVMTKPNVIFIAHSTGGVVVRYMLDLHFQDFADKNVGLVLVASPSYGSKQADRLKLLAQFYNNQMGLQLRWSSAILKDLDARFSVFLKEMRVPYLTGVEACENQFIVHRRWLPPLSLVVTPESGARYFRPCKILRETDHFTTVKPHSRDHPGYHLLLDFYLQDFANLLKKRAKEKPSEQAATTLQPSQPPRERLIEGIVPGYSRDYIVSRLGPAHVNNRDFPTFCEGFQQDVYSFPEAYVGIVYDPDDSVTSVFVLARTDDFQPKIPTQEACLGCESFADLGSKPSGFNWSSKEWYYIESIGGGMVTNLWTIELFDSELGRGHQYSGINATEFTEMIRKFRETAETGAKLQEYRQRTKPNGYGVTRESLFKKGRLEDSTCLNWYNVPLTYFTINGLSD